jgi:hypothetical protein
MNRRRTIGSGKDRHHTDRNHTHQRVLAIDLRPRIFQILKTRHQFFRADSEIVGKRQAA